MKKLLILLILLPTFCNSQTLQGYSGRYFRATQYFDAPIYKLNGVTKTFSQWTTSSSDIYFSTGKVGIGTNAPSTALDVIGTIKASELFIDSDSSTIKFQNDIGGVYWNITQRIDDEELVIRSSNYTNGLIGINKTPQYQLDVNGTIKASAQVYQAGTFAGIYVADASAAQSIANGTTYTKSTAFTTNGLSSNCTSDATNDKITITKTGKYFINGSFSFSGANANITWRGCAFLNGVEQSNIHWKRKITTAGDSGSASFCGSINVTSVPVDLDFRLRHDSGTTQGITIEYANLFINYIGE